MSIRSALVLFTVVALIAFTVVGATEGTALIGVMIDVALVAASLPVLVALDRKFDVSLPAIFLLATAVRWAVAILIEQFVYTKYPVLFAPDELHYDFAGWSYALYLAGKAPNPYAGESWMSLGTIQLAGVFYYFAGHVPLVPKLFIGMAGAWGAVCTAILAHRVYPSVARRAGFIAALFPSLVLWSSLLIKEATSLLGAQIALVSFVYLRERFRLSLVALFALGLLIIARDRPYEMAFVVLAVAGSFVYAASGRRTARNMALVLVVGVVGVFVLQRTFQSPIEVDSDHSVIEQVAQIRAGYAIGTGSAIRHDLVNESSATGLLLWIPIGLAYFFFAPVPFTGGSAISLATSPEMIAWYLLIPFMLRGLKLCWRYRRRQLTPMFVYALSSSIGWSMLVTNVGTIYRYRAQVLFVPILFIATAWAQRRGELTAAPDENPAPAQTLPAARRAA